jgi:hypothetical protein
MPFVTESTGEENANLYKRGVSEATASYSTPLNCSSFWMFSARTACDPTS